MGIDFVPRLPNETIRSFLEKISSDHFTITFSLFYRDDFQP